MDNKSKEIIEDLIGQLSNISHINPGDIPNIELYMDQVTTFMDSKLAPTKRYKDDKILTKTMINNYAKNKLLPPPIKKKYTSEHMVMLILIYYFKSFLSINDIQEILNPISDKFFDNDKSNTDLLKIYEEIYSEQKSKIEDEVKDITDKYKKSQTSFENFPKDEKDFLQLFEFIASLSFDIYVKKHLLEQLIDRLNHNNDIKKDEKTKKKNPVK
ncbi:protein of unknown function [Acetitomaculum ruminis DSM 5522]|uniref:DUF1836 domain-containing protein n=1 Tax=Acetitomaculum ruminis DSM 5522 TaxID=1120918 RepID=A0A1I1A6D1_9FIRM|nr:DUF1836 domain-containing protein [Acetitomaculum ruminis]SFB33521.1 protein of unknown function [Acetitomaculum ruminis DSM 5522]